MNIAVIGCGFWAQYQIAAWQEVGKSADVTLVGVCDRDAARAEATARRFGIGWAFTQADELLDTMRPDVVDIITTPETHEPFVLLAAERGIPVICQKPMATDFAACERMVAACERANVPFFIHENFRWQLPIRRVKTLLNDNAIGRPFRSRLYFNTGFPVFDNQPNLRELEQFILADLGVHLLDVNRFLFGEARSLRCLTQTIGKGVRGEDVATILLETVGGMHNTIELSFASVVPYDAFPQTLLTVEGTDGSIDLGRNLALTVTTRSGSQTETLSLPQYDWVNPDYAVVHTSMVPCNRNFLDALTGGPDAETTARDNLATLRLTYAAYESARTGETITVNY